MTTLHICRCEVCGVEFRLAQYVTICADCEEKGLTAADFDNWAAACDDVRGDHADEQELIGL